MQRLVVELVPRPKEHDSSSKGIGSVLGWTLMMVVCTLCSCMSPYAPNPVSVIESSSHKNIFTMDQSRVCNLGSESLLIIVLSSEGQETSRRVLSPGETYEYIPESGIQGFSLKNPTANNIEVSVYMKIHGEWTRF